MDIVLHSTGLDYSDRGHCGIRLIAEIWWKDAREDTSTILGKSRV